MKYKIVADSCCDIIESNKTFGKVDLIPLTLTLEGKDYIDDATFNQKEFYNMLARQRIMQDQRVHRRKSLWRPMKATTIAYSS